MALRHSYTDAFLAPRVTQAREDQANDEVTQLGTLPEAWVSRLTVLRCYMITCTESMQSNDDTFAAKLASYRKDYDTALPQARAAQAKAEAEAGTPSTGGSSFFTVDLSRG